LDRETKSSRFVLVFGVVFLHNYFFNKREKSANPNDGLIRREALVLDTCVGRGVPVAAYVGGGYDKDMDALARRHCILHHVAREIFESNKL
jgi:hypothetical protein